VQEHHGPVFVGVLVDGDPGPHASQQPRQAILALAQRQRQQVLAVKLQQVEGLEDGIGNTAAPGRKVAWERGTGRVSMPRR
jgi:hypothetical protein